MLYIGGGILKNFIQQTEVIAELIVDYSGGHSYAIQCTTDAPYRIGEPAMEWALRLHFR